MIANYLFIIHIKGTVVRQCALILPLPLELMIDVEFSKVFTYLINLRVERLYC